jgi:hypothetical protein
MTARGARRILSREVPYHIHGDPPGQILATIRRIRARKAR